ncbi:MAG: alpha/beta hydrolase [Turneriella sp.]
MLPRIPGVEISEKRVRTTDGYTLRVHCAGPDDGAPIIFLHGFPEFWYGWRKQIPYFSERGYRVIVPDQRGYNDSDKPPHISEYAIVQLADDVAAIVRQLHCGGAALVGHDWGAAAAWQAAMRYPAMFSRLAVLNVPHPRVMVKTLATNPKQLLKSWYMFFFQLPFFPAWLASLDGYRRFADAMRSSANPGSFTDDDMEIYIASWQKPEALNSMINWYRAAFQHPHFSGPHEVDIPTLILWGEGDRFLEASMAHESAAYCRNATVKYFPHATHWLQHDESEAVNAEIEKFIEDN